MKNSLKEWLCFVIIAACVIGWIANIVKIVTTFGDAGTSEVVVRIFGILFAPLGAVIGYF